MANWNLPTITSGYINFVDEINSKFVDAATLQFVVGTNIPLNTIRWNRSAKTFQEWLGPVSGWQDKVLSVAGGGTGSSTPTDVRTNLGLGSMATQNSNAVNITGGVIAGVTYSASDITAGVLALARGGTGASLSLGPYGTVLLSDGSGIVFAQGIYISNLDAGNLTQGTVPLARMNSHVVLDNVPNNFTTDVSFKAGGSNTSFLIQNDFPLINFTQNGGIVGQKNLRLVYSGGSFGLVSFADDWSSPVDLLRISNTGIVTANGGGITNINAGNLASGIVNTARLGTGAPDNTKFLRGDGIWAVPPTSAPGETIPSGLIALFDTNCPTGWTRVVALDGKFPLGSPSYGDTGGSSVHNHPFSAVTSQDGIHSHTYSGSAAGRVTGPISVTGNAAGNVSGLTGGDTGGTMNVDAGNSGVMTRPHQHPFSVDVNIPVSANGNIDISINPAYSGTTDQSGNHTHSVSGNTGNTSTLPPYITVVYCRKN